MVLSDSARNLYSAVQFGDLTLVLIKIQDTARVAVESSPNTTVTAAGSGVYNCTFEPGQVGWVLGTEQVGNGATTTEVVSFSASAGTLSVDTGSDLAGGDQCHIALLISKN